jgi:hypothetical protein
MLVTTDRELLLATSFSFSSSKVSQILEDRIPVTPRLSERVEFTLDGEKAGTFKGLRLDRDAPKSLNGITLRISLADSADPAIASTRGVLQCGKPARKPAREKSDSVTSRAPTVALCSAHTTPAGARRSGTRSAAERGLCHS